MYILIKIVKNEYIDSAKFKKLSIINKMDNLTSLCIPKSLINDYDIDIFCHYLISNTSLEELYIQSPNITNVGINHLFKCESIYKNIEILRIGGDRIDNNCFECVKDNIRNFTELKKFIFYGRGFTESTAKSLYSEIFSSDLNIKYLSLPCIFIFF